MNILNINKKKLLRGFTLIEILLVVGFIALASIGAYIIYNNIRAKNEAHTEARNLDVLRSGIKNLYASVPDYFGISSTVLLNGRVVPDNMRDETNGNIVNGFGGIVTLRNPNYGGGALNYAFTIHYPNVPPNVCTQFTIEGSNGFDLVEVQGTRVKDTTVGTPLSKNMANLAALCNGNGSGKTIEFTLLSK